MEVEVVEVEDEGEAGRVRSPIITDLVKLDPELYSRFHSDSNIETTSKN